MLAIRQIKLKISELARIVISPWKLLKHEPSIKNSDKLQLRDH